MLQVAQDLLLLLKVTAHGLVLAAQSLAEVDVVLLAHRHCLRGHPDVGVAAVDEALLVVLRRDSLHRVHSVLALLVAVVVRI